MDNFSLINDLISSYVNSDQESYSNHAPRFIYNDTSRDNPRKVFYTIKENLENCVSFAFSIAFINDSGLSLLKQVLRDIQSKNPQVKGRIITSNYLGFTEPKALEELKQFDNIEVRMYYINEFDTIGFHTKGYIFAYPEKEYKVIIGSSNITQSALTSNREWNNLLVGKEEGAVIQNILSEYERMWSLSLPLDEILSTYEKEYLERRKTFASSLFTQNVLKANPMQITFMTRLNEAIDKGQDRGLLISATGTGKTYASAFGVQSIKKFPVRKLLFVTHRETILKQAMETYKKVFKNEKKMALFTGNNHKIGEYDFLFSTISTIGEEKYYSQFFKEEFDVIIIDECHRIGKDTMYQNILNYFRPKFLLGMSATPDRTDGYDIYNLFQHHILYEIRLNDALESNMLVPFHYFGISDLTINGKDIDEATSINDLTCAKRVERILWASDYYGYSGKRRKCLLFVPSIEEGKILASEFNSRGVKSAILSGETNQENREKCIQKLEEDDIEKNDYLEILITRDIFNEGVDIPSVNQVIFLRPTKSSIIFIQQLGRGLRKHDGKEYLTVIDFIANYKTNFLIADVFSSKNSGQKRGERAIRPYTPLNSVVQFDEIATKRIIKAISRVNNTERKRISEQFIDIKNRLGRIPTLIEFDQGGKLSGRSFLDFYKNGFSSYYEFLFNKDYEKTELSQEKRDTLKYLSRMIGSGMRIYEALLLKTLISRRDEKDFLLFLDAYDKRMHQIHLYDKTIRRSILAVLSGAFDFRNSQKDAVPVVEMIDDEFRLTSEFKALLNDSVFYHYIDEIISYALYSQERYFSSIDDEKNNFVLYEKYTRRDALYLINHTKNDESTLYGYRVFKELNIVPLFVTYNKNLDEDASTNYHDCFVTRNIFLWDSASGRKLSSNEIQDIIKILKDPKGKVLLFVKRDALIDKNGNGLDNDRSFYYLGEVSLLGEPKEEQNGKEIKTDVVKFTFQLKHEVKEDLYQYLISKPLIED